MDFKCDSCNRNVQATWKYCRYCGSVQPKRNESLSTNNEVSSISDLETIPETEEVAFDRDLYHKVLSTRSHRSELIEEKKKLLESVNSLLEQLQSGLINRDYALPKITELKTKVKTVTEEEKQYEDMPEKLPLEVLLDEIDAAKNRMKKLEDLKNDPAISKEAIKDAKVQSEEALRLLKEQQSMVNGHLRNWQADLKTQLAKDRKELEQFYIRFKTGELTEEAYEERKSKKSKEITTSDGVLQLISRMLE